MKTAVEKKQSVPFSGSHFRANLRTGSAAVPLVKQMRKYEGLRLRLLSFEGQSYQKALETFASEFQESTGAQIETVPRPIRLGGGTWNPWLRPMPPPSTRASICFAMIGVAVSLTSPPAPPESDDSGVGLSHGGLL